MPEKVLITGGLGYIGSHTVVEMIEKGYEPLIIDNLSNTTVEVLDAIEKITGKRPQFEKVEMCDPEEMDRFFTANKGIKAVIHFAAALLVGESVEKPVHYYWNNLFSTINLLKSMKVHGVKNIVFSSSCTVYGNPDTLPVDEQAPFKPAASPYGNTKKMCEDILRDATAAAASDLKTISLRYFNPIGAHPTSLIGEVQHGEPHHLVPYITETAMGKRDSLKVFGGDYDTRDGSCIRDYIHVVDIAKAHVYAIERQLESKQKQDYEVFNLGTGNGVSVLEMIHAFTNATGKEINYEIRPRRPGDVEAVYADTKLANEELGWKAELSVEDMLKSAWDWEQKQ